MWKTTILALVVAAVVIGLVSIKSIKAPPNTADTRTPPTSATQAPRTEIVAQGLEVPWAIVFLPASPPGGPDNTR